MPITRKQQILAKIESNEGTAETLGANDADQVYEPGFQDSVDFSDRVPAGPTISRDYTPPGRQTREFTFQTDLRGSGSTSTAPAFAKYLQAAAYKASTLRQLTLGAVTGTGFQPGEQVYQGASYAAATAIGVVVAVLSASNVPVKLGNASGQLLVVAVVSGAFLNTTATVGNSSASSSTITADAAYTGFCYQPTSDKIVRLQTNTWSGGVAAVGDSLELRHNTSNVLLGAVRVVRNNGGGTFDDLACTVLWLQNGGFDATAGNNKLVTDRKSVV